MIAIPRYVIGAKETLHCDAGAFAAWPVRQEGVQRPRTVGYFRTLADAECYVSWATYFEQQASDGHGNRTV